MKIGEVSDKALARMKYPLLFGLVQWNFAYFDHRTNEVVLTGGTRISETKLMALADPADAE